MERTVRVWSLTHFQTKISKERGLTLFFIFHAAVLRGTNSRGKQ